MGKCFFIFALIGLKFSITFGTEKTNPNWLTIEKLELIKKIGIDPLSDIKTKGNYHYSYVAKVQLNFSNYKCPAGTSVDVSRNIILVRANDSKPCLDKQNNSYKNIRIGMDGSTHPL